MVSFALVLVLATVAVAAASPVARQFNGTTGSPSSSNSTPSATCRTFYSDIYAQASNLNLTAIVGGIPANQQVLVQSSIEQFKAGSTVNSQIANASKTAINGTYSIYFEFCQPTSGPSKGVFQTHHGLVGNAAYWNVRLNGSTQNSFAEAAAAAGWSTLSYDRLGVGNSSHPDGLTVVQINYEIAQSIGIAQALRNGYLPGISNVSRVVGVGHSYGSNLLTGVASSNPTVFDALVLTGFSGNTTSGPLGLGGFASTIASVAYPDRFGNLSNAYVSTPSVSTDQQEFFHYPNYTQGLLDLFTTGKSEYSLGQLYSIAAPLTLSRTNFTRPVLVVTGDSDAPYCAANCSITSLGGNQTNLDTARPLFPSVATANFSTYVVPATGHGINYHTTASLAYNRIISFVEGLRL